MSTLPIKVSIDPSSWAGSAKLQKNIEMDKILCLTAYDKIWFLAQKYEAIRHEKPPRVWQLSVACGLVFGGGEVEEGFVVTSFMLPVAY